MSETLTDFRKAVLERLHGCSYEEAIKIETENYYQIYENISLLGENDPLRHPSQSKKMPITLARLMAALNINQSLEFCFYGTEIVRLKNSSIVIGKDFGLGNGIDWKLLREDKTECDETDQTEETLSALTNILR